MNFAQTLEIGRTAESEIAQWLLNRGWCVLPVYEKQIGDFKGPQLTTPMGEYITPDLVALNLHSRHVLWVEAKHKTVFSWHRATKRWVTGIDIRHYNHYKAIDGLGFWPVWVFFLHTKSSYSKRDEPWPSPTGLFAQSLRKLAACENHRHANWGSHGMVYWAVESLMQVATLPQFYCRTQQTPTTGPAAKQVPVQEGITNPLF